MRGPRERVTGSAVAIEWACTSDQRLAGCDERCGVRSRRFEWGSQRFGESDGMYRRAESSVQRWRSMGREVQVIGSAEEVDGCSGGSQRLEELNAG